MVERQIVHDICFKGILVHGGEAERAGKRAGGIKLGAASAIQQWQRDRMPRLTEIANRDFRRAVDH